MLIEFKELRQIELLQIQTYSKIIRNILQICHERFKIFEIGLKSNINIFDIIYFIDKNIFLHNRRRYCCWNNHSNSMAWWTRCASFKNSLLQLSTRRHKASNSRVLDAFPY